MEASQKQRDYLAKLAGNKRNLGLGRRLDEVAAEAFGFDYYTDAPLTKRLASALIDIYTGKADEGLYVWAVRKDREEA